MSYGIAFITAKGKKPYRAAIGQIETGPNGPVIVEPILVSAPFDSEDEAQTALAIAVNGLGATVTTVGDAPLFDKLRAAAPAPATDTLPSEDLLQYPDAKGEAAPFDRRQLAVLVGLNRKWDNPAAKGAARIWHYLSEGMTVSAAVRETNRTMQTSFTPAEGYALAQREAYRLATHVAIVEHRDLAPRMPEKIKA